MKSLSGVPVLGLESRSTIAKALTRFFSFGRLRLIVALSVLAPAGLSLAPRQKKNSLRDRKSQLLVSSLALAGVLALTSCSEAPVDGDCAKLFAHLVDMQAAGSKATAADKDKHRAAMESDEKVKFVERCELDIKAVQVTCSLKAKTMDDLDACDNKS